MTDDILAYDKFTTNGDLIEACFTLGYLADDMVILDPTYGEGVFWKVHGEPENLHASDLDPFKTPTEPDDFRDLPWADEEFDAVVFDPPYKLNGTGDKTHRGVDHRYGVEEFMPAKERMIMCLDGITECYRVLKPEGVLLIKCQNQVNSGRIVWQADIFGEHAKGLGMTKEDQFNMLGMRAQPKGRRQAHARQNASQLLVMRKWK